eukprot:2303207-Lingulodinium_polyedra.AAC.1
MSTAARATLGYATTRRDNNGAMAMITPRVRHTNTTPCQRDTIAVPTPCQNHVRAASTSYQLLAKSTMRRDAARCEWRAATTNE